MMATAVRAPKGFFVIFLYGIVSGGVIVSMLNLLFLLFSFHGMHRLRSPVRGLPEQQHALMRV
jgi:hypothetical protein